MNKIIGILIYIFLFNTIAAQETILDVRENFVVGDNVFITGTVINGAELGSVRYIQDNTAGIAIYPGANWDEQGFVPELGDEVSVSGTISEFAHLLEIGPQNLIVTLQSENNPLPSAIDLFPNDLNEAYEAQLVRIAGANFTDGGSIFSTNTYNFTANGESAVIYVPSSSPFIGQLIPSGPVDITGILSQFSFDNPSVGYQILPRTETDLVSENPINFASAVEQLDLSTSGFSLHWSTDVASGTGVFYGTTPSLGDMIIVVEDVTDHSVSLSGLASGTPYYCQVFSVAGTDTAFSTIGTYSTVSESSGSIKVYFNRSVDNSVATEENAISLFGATDDTIAAYIDRAQTSLDIAVYNNNNGVIVQAINEALDRGVTIRYITEGQNANTALASMNSAIPVLARQNATSSGMHNKFMIIDAENVDSAIVMMGSMNFTSNNLFSDPNNFMFIQDQALARAYTIEFNEMWGSSGAHPNASESRFGEFKINNTPKKFIIGERDVELYFSPSDNTTAEIAEAIETTDYDLDFALLLITNNILADAIVDVTNIFVQPRGIVETPNEQGSDFDFLISEGVQMLSHEGVDGQLHHKYATIDYSEPLSNPTVVTGSHNWSSSAESVNDENTLIIHDATIANLYFQEFTAIYNGLVVGVDEIDVTHLAVYPNPSSGQVSVQFDSRFAQRLSLRILDIAGKEVYVQALKSFEGQNLIALDISGLSPGVYLVSLSGEWGLVVGRLVVGGLVVGG